MSAEADPPDWERFLDVRPVRAIEWTEAKGHVVLTRPRPEGSGWRRLGGWLRQLLVAPRVRLDDLGSFCWKRFDGTCSLRGIAEALREAFGDRADHAEERLVTFARSLAGEGWLRVPGERDADER